jgi:hypothetical protein
VIPPPPFPSFTQALKEKRGDKLQPHQYPCTNCWTAGCAACGDTGVGSRESFFTWYGKLKEIHLEALERYSRWKDKQRQGVVGRDYYDLETLRKIATRRG